VTALLLAAVLVLTNRFGSVSVETMGARVTSYVPAGGQETLAMLPSGYGGIPLCWPWFQYNGPNGKESPKHGLARYREFAVVEQTNGPDAGRVVLRLRSDDETRRQWPHDFELTLAVSLDGRGLSLVLTSENVGDGPFSVTEAFHPYLLRDRVRDLSDSGSGAYRTWDPDATSHRKTQGLAPDDWKKFVCVENGIFEKDRAFVLQPGERHSLTRTLTPKAALAFTPEDASLALETARRLVDECTPRDAGTVRGRMAADCILEVAQATGAEVRRDVFRARTPEGEKEFTNLYAEFGAESPDSRWVVLLSHYDTKPGTGSPGANDGASTSGLLVGLARAMVRRTKPEGNLLLVWTDGEECMKAYGPDDGLWGSRRAVEYVESKARKIRAVICLDMLGDGDLSITVPSNGSPALSKIAVRSACKAGYPDLVRQIPYAVTDDHVPFLEKGYPAIDLIDFSYGPANAYWHTPQDTTDKISHESLLKSGRVVVEMLNVLL